MKALLAMGAILSSMPQGSIGNVHLSGMEARGIRRLGKSCELEMALKTTQNGFTSVNQIECDDVCLQDKTDSPEKKRAYFFLINLSDKLFTAKYTSTSFNDAQDCVRANIVSANPVSGKYIEIIPINKNEVRGRIVVYKRN